MESRSEARWRSVGALFFIIGPVQFVAAMILEEALRPGYSPISNVISDLGVGSYSTIFNLSVIMLGLFTMFGIALIHDGFPRNRNSRLGYLTMVIVGFGAIGVGCFPENTHAPHAIAAFIAFFGSGLAMLFYSSSFRGDLDWSRFTIPTALGGIITIVSLFLFVSNVLGSGVTGLTERAIVAPVLIWAAIIGVKFLTRPVPVSSTDAPNTG
jgi:hypothetical membrane protein